MSNKTQIQCFMCTWQWSKHLMALLILPPAFYRWIKLLQKAKITSPELHGGPCPGIRVHNHFVTLLLTGKKGKREGREFTSLDGIRRHLGPLWANCVLRVACMGFIKKCKVAHVGEMCVTRCSGLTLLLSYNLLASLVLVMHVPAWPQKHLNLGLVFAQLDGAHETLTTQVNARGWWTVSPCFSKNFDSWHSCAKEIIL